MQNYLNTYVREHSRTQSNEKTENICYILYDLTIRINQYDLERAVNCTLIVAN